MHNQTGYVDKYTNESCNTINKGGFQQARARRKSETVGEVAFWPILKKKRS